MQGTKTLATLIQLKEAEIERLLSVLAEAETELSTRSIRHEALSVERDRLAAEIRLARRSLTRPPAGRSVTAHAQQLQYCALGRLNAELATATRSLSLAFDSLEQARHTVEGLRVELTQHLGEKASYRTTVERKERSLALRQESQRDEALLENWSSRPRPG